MGTEYLFRCGRCKNEEYRELPRREKTNSMSCNACGYCSNSVIIIPAYIPDSQWDRFVKIAEKKGEKDGKIYISDT